MGCLTAIFSVKLDIPHFSFPSKLKKIEICKLFEHTLDEGCDMP